MRSGAIVGLVVAALSALVAVNKTVGRANYFDAMENRVGYPVAAFPVPVVLLVDGPWLWGKSRQQ
jgi:hypothetical protein